MHRALALCSGSQNRTRAQVSHPGGMTPEPNAGLEPMLGPIPLHPCAAPDPGQALFKQEHGFAHQRDLNLGEMSALGARLREKPLKTFLRGDKHQALRCPSAALSLLEKPFPPLTFRVAPPPLPAPTTSRKLQPWHLPSNSSTTPAENMGFCWCWGGVWGAPRPCVLLVSCSSASRNPWSSTRRAGATTCPAPPQTLCHLLTQRSEGDHPQPARLWETLKGSTPLCRFW